jgi:hypothetical protein
MVKYNTQKKERHKVVVLPLQQSCKQSRILANY